MIGRALVLMRMGMANSADWSESRLCTSGCTKCTLFREFLPFLSFWSLCKLLSLFESIDIAVGVIPGVQACGEELHPRWGWRSMSDCSILPFWEFKAARVPVEQLL
jgi:hypothetical protein